MKFSTLMAVFATWISNVSAYEVWMGTHLMGSADANDLPAWALTASQLDGFNSNRAPHDPDPASSDGWRTIYAQFTSAWSAIAEFTCSQATRDPSKTDKLAFPSITQRLENIFSFENNFGYDLTAIMFYDERGTLQGTEYLYEWTDIEIQHRDHDSCVLSTPHKNHERNYWSHHPIPIDLRGAGLRRERRPGRHGGRE
ncbi:MAG: hypothetical protein P8P32_00410 [Akkermansiaceae bacterium]|nr:hypothetical protein [Akkermansiaceae bacterium]